VKLPSLQEMLGLSRAQLGEFLVAALEFATAPKPKPRWALYRYVFDETNGERSGNPHKFLEWIYADKEAALSALRALLQYPLPHTFWDIEEMASAAEEQAKPSVAAQAESLQSRITNISGDLEAVRDYHAKMRHAYETFMIMKGSPLSAVEVEAWQAGYPPYVSSTAKAVSE